MSGIHTKNDRLSWALYWALRGFAVFPVYPDSKRPVNTGWPDVATSDPAQVEAWWLERPEANIGCVPGASGHVVIDVDNKKADGEATLATLPPLPVTMETHTPSGGRHIWLALDGSSRNSAGGLGPSIDVRGNAGYVLMPGSTCGGKDYTIANDAPVAPAPEPWRELFGTLGAKAENRKAGADVSIDLPDQIALATRHLRTLAEAGDVAVEGAGGNDRTYRLFTWLRDAGIGEDTACELVEEHWNGACLPPWAPEELETIAHNAHAYAQNEAGAKASGDGSGFAGIPVPAAGSTPPPVKRNRFDLLSIEDMADLDEPAWLVPGWLPHFELSMLYGAPGSMKSFGALDLALSISAGRLPWGITGSSPAFPVIYIAGEGQIGIAKKRIPAWLEHNREPASLPFRLVREAPLARNGDGDLAQLFESIEASCGEALPRLVVIDTHQRVMSGLDENAAQDTSKTIEFYDAIRRRYSCSVLLIHHSGVDGARERGSSVLRGACETVLRMDKHEGGTVLRCEKMKDAEPPEAVSFGITKAGPSIVLTPRDFVAKVKGHSELYSDVAAILRENECFTLAKAMTTAALAASMPQIELETNEVDREAAKRKLAAALNRAAGGELRPLTAPDLSPPAWLLPPLD